MLPRLSILKIFKMKKTSLFVLIIPVAPFILGFQFQRYIIESRKARSVTSIFEQFSPCQITLITNQMKNLRVITAVKMPIQIFFLPFNYSDPYKSLLKSFENLAFYSVFYGQQYTVKSCTSVCKLNVISHKNKSGKLDPGSPFFAYYVSHLGPI